MENRYVKRIYDNIKIIQDEVKDVFVELNLGNEFENYIPEKEKLLDLLQNLWDDFEVVERIVEDRENENIELQYQNKVYKENMEELQYTIDEMGQNGCN